MTSEFAIGVHALVYLNHKNETLSSELLAENICTNPARIRKVMAKLKTGGLIVTQEGLKLSLIHIFSRCRAVIQPGSPHRRNVAEFLKGVPADLRGKMPLYPCCLQIPLHLQEILLLPLRLSGAVTEKHPEDW